MANTSLNSKDRKKISFVPDLAEDEGDAPTSYSLGIAPASSLGVNDVIFSMLDEKTMQFIPIVMVSNGDGTYSLGVRRV